MKTNGQFLIHLVRNWCENGSGPSKIGSYSLLVHNGTLIYRKKIDTQKVYVTKGNFTTLCGHKCEVTAKKRKFCGLYQRDVEAFL